MLHAAEVPKFVALGVAAGEQRDEAAITEAIAFGEFVVDTAAGQPSTGPGVTFEGDSTIVHLRPADGIEPDVLGAGDDRRPDDAGLDDAGLDDAGLDDGGLTVHRSTIELVGRPVASAPIDVEAWSTPDGRLVVRLPTRRPYTVRAEIARRLQAPAAAVRVIARPVSPGADPPTGDPATGELAAAVGALAREAWDRGAPLHASVRPVRSKGSVSCQRVEVTSLVAADGTLEGLTSTVVGTPPPSSEEGRAPAEVGRQIAVGAHLAALVARPRNVPARVIAADGDAASIDDVDVDDADACALDTEALAEQTVERRWSAEGRSSTMPASLIRAWREAQLAIDPPHGIAVADDGRRRGTGRGIGMRPAEAADGRVGATVALTEDGSLLVAVSAADLDGSLGDGLARIVAEVFATYPEDVRVTAGDTDRVAGVDGPCGFGGFATAARAVKRAADELRVIVARQAAAALEVTDWRTIEIGRRRATDADRRQIGLGDLAARPAAGAVLLVGHGQASGGEQAGTAAAVAALAIAIDTETGEVELERVVLAIDAGVVVAPGSAAGAVRRATAGAVQWLLGGPAATFDPDVVFIESVDDDGPFGARSLPDVTAALTVALGEAISDAVGLTVDRWPLDPAWLWTMLTGRTGPD